VANFFFGGERRGHPVSVRSFVINKEIQNSMQKTDHREEAEKHTVLLTTNHQLNQLNNMSRKNYTNTAMISKIHWNQSVSSRIHTEKLR